MRDCDAIRMERAEAKQNMKYNQPEAWQDAIRMERAEAKIGNGGEVGHPYRCNPHGTC